MRSIVLFTDAFWPNIGGVEVLAAGLGEAMAARGYEMLVVTGRTDDASPAEGEHRGVKVHRFPFVQAVLSRDVEAIALSMSGLSALYADLSPDLYHVIPTGPAALFHLKAASRCPAPSLVGIQLAMPERHDDGQLTGQLLRSAQWTTACSENMLAYTRTLTPEIGARSSVLYNAVPAPDRPPVPLPEDDPKILCLGRVVDDKGFDLALKALPTILEEVPTTRLVVAGDGNARARLEGSAADLGISHRVEFMGAVERADVPALIDDASVVVMPSRWEEAFGLVAVEAAQRARPVVAARVGGLQEVVLDGMTGTLVPREDPVALAGAVVGLLRDPDKARKWGEQAYERAMDLFGWDRFVDSHEALYERLIREYSTHEDHA